MRANRLFFLAVVSCFSLTSVAPAQDKENKELTKKLEAKISLDKGIEENTPLSDALAFAADRFEFTIVVDSKAFAKAGVPNVEEKPVSLKPVKDVPVGKVLQTLLDKVDATYKTEKGQLVVIPKPKK